MRRSDHHELDAEETGSHGDAQLHPWLTVLRGGPFSADSYRETGRAAAEHPYAGPEARALRVRHGRLLDWARAQRCDSGQPESVSPGLGIDAGLVRRLGNVIRGDVRLAATGLQDRRETQGRAHQERAVWSRVHYVS